ncbi:TraB/GumN family protein [Halorubrum ezzemoulense]|uniref:TraB/GumN family protein n=1 Tax=Halorubrum ezzemoulense TaxID=337243 RepID=UPI00232DC4AE|nr:TraB/GumN family protein [Halorubrum ezzemoulense]MDB2225136.1 TraB/GumN family protein [Halorubrum ezzemoulense]MDB2270971.1 TraB/GumN family protein [Halorubrum ezzemoulense]MDB2274061.1 TraB/GumN family protein [Halorubrum ezzemoulense]
MTETSRGTDDAAPPSTDRPPRTDGGDLDRNPGRGPAADGEGSVTVVGTAHVSERSVDEVEETIERERPDVVAVELDEGRYRQMNGETPDDLDAGDLLRGNTVFQFLAYWMLSYVQTQLGERFDIEPGADMKAAVDIAESLGIDVALVDRDIQTTIQRFWARMTITEKLRLVGGLAFGVSDPRVAGAIGGLLVGILAGPAIGLFGGAVGITDAILTSVAAGVLVALGVGIAVDQVGSLALSPDQRLYAAVGTGLSTGVAAGVTGAANGPVSAYLGGFPVAAIGGFGIGIGLGLVVGAVLAIAVSGFGGGEVDPEAGGIEELDAADLTDTDVVTMMMEEFRQFSPGGAEALIDERDAFIAHRLVALREAGHDVVAVVGAGHQAGIERYLAEPATLPAMDDLVGEESGRGLPWKKAIGYAITVGFVGFFLLLALGGAGNAFLLRLFGAWFLINGVFAFAFAKVAGARWLSAGVGGAVAWMTSINPLLAPGWFTGYVELRSLTVNVADIGALNDLLGDETRSVDELVSAMLDVPLFRLIVVVAMTNVGSIVASFLFAAYVIPAMFGAEVGGVDEVGRLLVEGAVNGADLVRGAVGGIA